MSSVGTLDSSASMTSFPTSPRARPRSSSRDRPARARAFWPRPFTLARPDETPPFVKVSCAALPENLLESELFGYRKGAFTDARRDKPGRIAAANGGTLFLDEIGDVPLSVQVKLLGFLQDREYEPLGANRPVRADVRVIAATNRNLTQIVKEGRFREDLFYRSDHAPTRIGKKNLVNNFCIATPGNEVSCMKCHAGYGWSDQQFDFSDRENIDCLVCHEHAGTYVKGPAGMPMNDTDLTAVARSVGTPTRDNCLGCHAYGGGGQGVKHGDLDSSLNHPPDEEDVHMSRYGFLCVDCHEAPDHRIHGRAFSVSVGGPGGVSCADCHTTPKHADARIDAHLSSVACQSCHIPTFARSLPTKAYWDWSKAGDPTRAEDPHTYLKIKGESSRPADSTTQGTSSAMPFGSAPRVRATAPRVTV